MTDPAQVMARLVEIEADLATRQNSWGEAAEELARLKRDYEKRLAQALVAADPDLKVDERKAAALLALAAAEDNVYGRFVEAEAAYEGHRAVFNVLEKRASIGQSLLRALTAESFSRGAPAPSWSDGAR